MKKLDIKFIAIIGVVALTVIGGLYQLFVSPILTSYYLRKETRYGVTTGLSYRYHGRIGHTTLIYNFRINEKSYVGECDERNLNERHNYFIAFNPYHPGFSKMTYIEATKADIDNMPSNGYTQLPHQ